MSHHIVNLLRDALVHYGYWAVAAMLLLESAGLPLPGRDHTAAGQLSGVFRT
jgi:hypothetical protein